MTARVSILRRQILEAAYLAGEGHIASAFSVLEIIFGVYSSEAFRTNKESRFLLSKGHASLALYAVLGEFGLISQSWVNEFCRFDSKFGGHPDSTKIREIQISSGSLGHGLPIGVGICLANRARNKQGPIVIVIGDGELNEGSNWESLLVAAHHQLTNLHLIVDLNNSGERAVSLGDLSSKFEAFGCDVFEIDGHDINSIQDEIARTTKKVKVTLASTIKGFGIVEMESNPEWHHKVPSKAQYEQFLEQLR